MSNETAGLTRRYDLHWCNIGTVVIIGFVAVDMRDARGLCIIGSNLAKMIKYIGDKDNYGKSKKEDNFVS